MLLAIVVVVVVTIVVLSVLFNNTTLLHVPINRLALIPRQSVEPINQNRLGPPCSAQPPLRQTHYL